MISPVSAGGGFTRTGIGTIVDMSSLEIEVDVNETYINRVVTGQKVEATLDAYPDWQIPAHVITTIPSADRQKATVKVRIGFDALDPRILPDMGVKVSFLRDEPAAGQARRRRAVIVPKAAIRSVDGKAIVFVVNDDRVERRAVQRRARERRSGGSVSGVARRRAGRHRRPADAERRRQGEGADISRRMSKHVPIPGAGSRSPQGVPPRRRSGSTSCRASTSTFPKGISWR